MKVACRHLLKFHARQNQPQSPEEEPPTWAFCEICPVTRMCSQGLSHLVDKEKAGIGPQEPGPRCSFAHGTPIPQLRSPISQKMILTTRHAKN